MVNPKDYGADYLLVNTTNRFLLEYAPLSENSCNKLTGFTGDTGDALLCPDGESYLFVDGRYHTQADNEVNHDITTVVKLTLEQKQDEEICARIKPYTTLGIVGEKVSQTRLEFFQTLLKEINVGVKVLPFDPFDISKKTDIKKAVIIDQSLNGANFSEKITHLEKPSLFTNSEEISYLCNLRDFSQDFAVKIDGKLLVLEDKSILFSDIEVAGGTDFEIKPLSEFEGIISEITESVRVDKSTINAYDYSLIKKPVSVKSPVKLMKSVKNDAELSHMKYCFEMTDKALMATRDFIYNNDGLSEYDIDIELTKNFKKFGAKSLSFKSIVARNQNAAQAHYMNSSKDETVKDGDLVLIDCGAYYDGGLATDITRVFVKGEPSEKHKMVYTTVLKMFLNAFNFQVVEGKSSGFEIDGLAREVLKANPVEGFSFSHGLGHGIGVCVHEVPPNLSVKEIAKTPLKNNMCFTIEPGLYNSDEFGVRLENSCYLENGVIKSFTDMCYEEKLIDFSMLSEDEKEWLKGFKVL